MAGAMEIRTKTGNEINMSIINSYAPHIGRDIETIKDCWGETLISHRYQENTSIYGALTTKVKYIEMGKWE